MSTQDVLAVETATRQKSWRDTLSADYEIQQARLRLVLEDSADLEEFI